MIQLNKISLSFKDRILFDDISASFGNQKIGLVGRNGAGKSTLLRVIAGLTPIDEGSVSIQRNTTVAYMPQELVLESTKSVFDETYSIFQHFIDLENEKNHLEELLPQNPDNIEQLLERYVEVEEKVRNFDKVTSLEKTKATLNGLGFKESMQEQSVSTLSVGWKMRVALAKLLLQDADFYLFDEPTNHLDIVSKEWFCSFLKEFNGGFLLVSHDRYFLDAACNYIFEVERGNGHMFTGNFTRYLEQKEAIREITQSSFEQQQKDIARKQATIDRFKASASRSRMAQSMVKQLDRIELIEVEPPMPTITIKLAPTTRPGSIVLTLNNVSQEFDGKTIFKNVSGEIKRGQKVALVAANGVGKTTLFELIAGKLPLQSGSITFGHNVTSTIFEQDQARVLKADNTVYEEICESAGKATESTIRAFLGAFLFKGDDIHKKIKVLSGGERNRVAMVKVFLQNANLLLLDEPTNHLDLYAKEVLLQALLQYDGSILFVSHDHDFIHKLATNIWELTPNGIFSFEGTYEEYLWFKKQQQPANTSTVTTSTLQTAAVAQKKEPSSQDKETTKQLKALENNIAKTEKDIAREVEELSKHSYGSELFKKHTAQLQKLQTKLQEFTAQWETLFNRL